MKRILAVSLLSIIALQAPAQSDVRARIESRATARFEEFRKEAGFPGAVFAYVLPDGTSASIAVGLADPDTGEKMKPESRMLAGSIGKTFFAAWILKMVEQGKVDLDVPLSRYLGKESWFGRLPNAPHLTLKLLMLHQSGIPEQVYDPGLQKTLRDSPDKVWSPTELIALCLDKKPLFEAGKGWSYADTNYIIATYAVQQATGLDAYEEIKKLFLAPLKLDRTEPSTKRKLSGLVMGHATTGKDFTGQYKTIRDGQFVINPQMEWAGGGFVSNALDLARWAKALYGGSILKPTTSSLQKQGVAAKTGRGEFYGLGVQIRPTEGGNGFGHGGFFPGYLSEMELLPDGIAVAIQYNADGSNVLLANRRRYMLDLARIVREEWKR